LIDLAQIDLKAISLLPVIAFAHAGTPTFQRAAEIKDENLPGAFPENLQYPLVEDIHAFPLRSSTRW